ncbi:MAG: hypothetical protein FJ399_13250, partial [Verrucomicrobia bacterium]|nr:hypothetical protein [Verrucomicrobiota bacterium]
MKTPVGFNPLVQRPPLWRRLMVAVGALTLGVSVALAQTFNIGTLAGTAGSSGNTDSTGTAARFFNPKGVAVDASGNAYVADSANHTIRKIVINTGVVTTIAGTAGSSGSADGTGPAARFNAPQGVAVSGTDLFVSDTFNHTIRKIDLTTNAVTTVAGTAGSFGTTDATGATARFNGPIGLVAVGANLYVADTGNSSIRQVVIATGVVTTFAGSTSGATGTLDGTGTAARFDHAGGIAADALNLYVADTNNHAVRKIVISSGVVTTIAGTAGTAGQADGTGTAATFRFPGGVGVDGSGTNLYVADSNNHAIRRVVISTAAVTTVGGSAGLIGTTDGVGSAARFQGPYGITVDSGGSLYVADVNNQTIRRATVAVAPSVSNPANVTAALNGSATFTVTVSGNPT